MLKRLFIVYLVFVAGVIFAHDASFAEQGRKALAKSDKAMVTVEVTHKITMGAEVSERKFKSQATIVDASGLAVAPLSGIDPFSEELLERFAAGGKELKNEVAACKIIFSDGSDVDAEFILKDEDIGVAFLAPKKLSAKDKAKFVALDTKITADSLKVLESLVTFVRTGEANDYAIIANFTYVSSKLTKPSEAYVLDYSELGSVVFNRKGEFVGFIFLMKNNAGRKVKVVYFFSELTDLITQAKEEIANR